jgi:hypothetical protein
MDKFTFFPHVQEKQKQRPASGGWKQAGVWDGQQTVNCKFTGQVMTAQQRYSQHTSMRTHTAINVARHKK